MRDPAVRARVKREVKAGSQPGWSNLVFAAGGWDHVVLVGTPGGQYDQYVGKSIAAIGRQRKQDPTDVAMDIVLAGEGKRSGALYFLMSEQDIETALRQPWVSIGSDSAISDEMNLPNGGAGRAHPRGYGNFVRVIAEYVKKRHVLTLEDAVRKMTGWPAQRMGLSDRGLVREGMRADVIVFDLAKLQDTATYEHPVAAATGIDDVIVNGVPAIAGRRMTGARSGQVLRHPCTMPAAL